MLLLGFPTPPYFKRALILFILLVGAGTFFYSHVEGWNYLDSIYFSIISLTTVGYGDFHPTHSITKFFTMFYILFGVGLMLYIVATLTHFMNKKEEKK